MGDPFTLAFLLADRVNPNPSQQLRSLEELHVLFIDLPCKPQKEASNLSHP
jgi:hypothetical protein